MVVYAPEIESSSLPVRKSKKKVRLSKAERQQRKALKVLRGQTEQFEVIHLDAAGIDVGSEQMFVAVPADRDPKPVQVFGTCTEELHRLADWLIACRITTVAMESTGVYWIPLFQILESRGIKVCLVNARFAKSLPGRKTDMLDCQWLQKLHTFGLLTASFRPADEICVLRSFIRQRETLIQDAGREVQHMQKALTQMNVLVHNVVTDITGKTGMAIVEAILQGERNPLALAALRDCRCQKDERTIAQALAGDFRREHLFALKQSYDSWRHTRQQIRELDQEVQQLLGTFERETDETLPPKTKKPKQNEMEFDLANELYQIIGVDVTKVYGIETLTALKILSEIGFDLRAWPTCRHFCSWLGLCPHNKISGGRILVAGTRRVANRVAKALRLAAKSLQRSQNALGAFFRRMAYKLGYHAAVTATAHKLARILYALLKNRRAFDPAILDLNHADHERRRLRSLQKTAASLGYELVRVEAAPTA